METSALLSSWVLSRTSSFQFKKKICSQLSLHLSGTAKAHEQCFCWPVKAVKGWTTCALSVWCFIWPFLKCIKKAVLIQANCVGWFTFQIVFLNSAYARKVVIRIKTIRWKCFLSLTGFVSVLWACGPWNNQICFDIRTGFLPICYPSHRVPIESSPTVPAWSTWFWRFVEMLVILSGISTTET